MSAEGRMAPVFLSPGKRKITVFGGGPVALRKCLHFAGFDITAVSEDFVPEMEKAAGKLIRATVGKDNALSYMKGAFLVIAATNSKELNAEIRDIAKENGIPVNSAHGGGDVLIPSTLRRGGFTVTVSSEGRAPAFPPYVIEEIDGFLDEGYERMLALLVRIRPKVMAGIEKQPDRAEFLAGILRDGKIWEMLRSGNEYGAYAEALKKGGLA
jgi:precorrin-2 dehydrogenase/sirohydrochlorin ferrochelatase